MATLDIPKFHSIDLNPGATLQLFTKYIEDLELFFQLIFRKSDGTPYVPSEKEKRALLLLKGGEDMRNLLEYVGKIAETDTFAQIVEKVKTGLSERTNEVVQRNLLFANFPQGKKSFEKWSQEISNAAKLISYQNYDWKKATVDAILLQTSNSRLRERALQENCSYDDLMKMGVAKEQSARGAALLEKASGSSSQVRIKVEEEVRKLQLENRDLKSRLSENAKCTRCGSENCSKSRCPANGRKCSVCGKANHLAQACRSKSEKNSSKSWKNPKKGKKNRNPVRQLSSAEDSESESESSGRIVVGHLKTKSIQAKVGIKGKYPGSTSKEIMLATDTGISKTLLNRADWESIRDGCKFVKTSKRFRPYGTAYHLPIKGKALVTLTAERGAEIETWVYVVDDQKESSLLGETDAIRLGIVKLDLKGSKEEIVNKIEYLNKSDVKIEENDYNKEVDSEMDKIRSEFADVISDTTGKVKGPPIKIQFQEDATPTIQPPRRIPLHYMSRLEEELKKMKSEDIIEGPLDIEEPGTFISNLVITDKKDNSGRIRVTLDCQAVNKVIYPTHEPIPTIEELRHKLKGSDLFSTIDMTNCYYQFEIEEEARKLYAFRSPWGIYRYKRMVMGTSPASSEVQKRIRSIINKCDGAIHIKDDILVHGVGNDHHLHLRNVLKTLRDNGITVRPSKCVLGKPEVKWFGYIISKHGMSPDPEKCKVIQDWPAPNSKSEVKSFLQTVQFNSKFLGGQAGEASYPELTEPLRAITKKYARFRWGEREESAFVEIKRRLISNRVLIPYDTSKPTRLYVDSSPVGTQATICQQHELDGNLYWRPVNHTSRAWTPPEAKYSQIERESNGILTGMYMNKMYTSGGHIEIVTDHEPLLSAYSDSSNLKQLRVDRHRTKLLSFQYNLVYEPGKDTPCDYGSRHPPKSDFSQQEIDDWCIEVGDDIYVNRVIEDSLPCAITVDMIKKEIVNDKDMKLLYECISTQNKGRVKKNLKQYVGVFPELYLYNGIILKGSQILIPPAFHSEVVGIAHEGHQYADKTLSLLRQTCWFPKMRKCVLDYVESCIGCLAAIPQVTPVPLEPNFLPERAWKELHADFKGPIGGKYYFHVMIDQYSKYPEVDILTSTSFKKLRPCLDRIFSSQGIPERVTADNGPPYPSFEMDAYAKEMGFEMKPTTPNDPAANGFAEVFVKILCKLLHTSVAEGKDPKAELYKYLLHYRATPHPTTGVSPSEMLNGRRLRTKLPFLNLKPEDESIKEIRKRHDDKKLEQKRNFDRRRKAKVKDIKVGDSILVRQEKSTTKPPFDPNPYIVEEVVGNKVSARRDNQVRVRDKNYIKKVKVRPDYIKPSWEKDSIHPITDYDEQEIECSWGMNKVLTPLEGEPIDDIEDVQEKVMSEESDNGLEDNPINDIEDVQETVTYEDEDNGSKCDPEIEEPTSEKEMEEHLNHLIEEAQRRVTRSQGATLTWNPIMGDKNVVLEK